MKNRIHEKLLDHQEKLASWYREKTQNAYLPFYASFDIRDAGFKIGNVDGNIYPAGFNNICQTDKETTPEIMGQFIKKKFPQAQKLLLLSEDHLKNAYYWENVIAIRDMLEEAGYRVDVGMLSPEINGKATLESFTGKTIEVHQVTSKEGQLVTSQGQPDLVISNNDFSNPYNEIDFSQTQMTPLRELGWYQRKKHCYFYYYNQYVEEFAKLIGEDPWLFQVGTERFEGFDVGDEGNRGQLADHVDQCIEKIQKKYDEHGIDQKPFVFVKNNSGTYGLGVVTATSGDDVEEWNYKARKKMKATKGGGGVNDVIVQEGIPSVLTEDDATAEPAVYMVGSELVGGFLRTHAKKDGRESLNSPGAVYKRLCLSDLRVKAEGRMLENVYGWVAKLGLLAISTEGEKLPDPNTTCGE